MRVPVRVFATEALLQAMDDQVFHQAANVATLPGIVGYSFVMPDAHWGDGFPIGGVAAMDPKTGVILPGGIGFDINCGMRLVLTNLTLDEVPPKLRNLVDVLYQRVPAGVGCRGFVKLSESEFAEVIEQGARWCVRNGYGTKEDLDRTEERGCLTGADAATVSPRAIERGYRQIGTLGSGNHYLEIQVARPEHVVDATLAAALGITLPNQTAVMFHCGSRGFGHQVATDYLQVFLHAMTSKYGLEIIDRDYRYPQVSVENIYLWPERVPRDIYYAPWPELFWYPGWCGLYGPYGPWSHDPYWWGPWIWWGPPLVEPLPHPPARHGASH
jgi:tRNA-splicing ligase RtcB